MTVILFFCVGLFFLFFAGYGFTRLVYRREGKDPEWHLILVNGYCITTILFSELTWFSEVPLAAFVIAIAVCVILNVRYFIQARKRPDFQWRLSSARGYASHLRSEADVYILAFAVVILVGACFMLSGWSHFWGSANGDAFDGLRGRDLLLSDPTNFFAERMGFYQESPEFWYQYSVLAFWSLLLGSFGTMDVFYLHGLFMLFMMVVGVNYFCQKGLGLSRPLSLMSAAVAGTSSLFVSTYYTGHEGSLIFAALIPYLMALAIGKDTFAKLRAPSSLLLLVYLYTLLRSYPAPLGFVLVPLVLYLLIRLISVDGALPVRTAALVRKARQFLFTETKAESVVSTRRKKYAVIGIVGLLALLSIGFLWLYFEPTRLRASVNYRAWGISQHKEMMLIYWGTVPSSIPFGLGGVVHLYTSLMIVLAYVVSIGCVLVSLIGIRTLFRRHHDSRLFVLLYAACWPMFFLFMKFVVLDSYYLYKFLYSNLFMNAIFFAAGLSYIASLNLRSSKIWRTLAVSIGIVYFGANLGMLLLYNFDLLSRPYNGKTAPAYTQIDSLKRFEKEGMLFSYARGNFYSDRGNLVSYILENKGIATQKVGGVFKYVLFAKGNEDIFSFSHSHDSPRAAVAWQNEVYEVRPATDTDLLLPVDNKFRSLADSWYGPEKHDEVYSAYPFRWASYKLDFFLMNTSGRLPYFTFCVEPGPGLSQRPFTLYVYVGEKQMGDLPLDQWSRLVSSGSVDLGKPIDSIDVRGLSSVSVRLPGTTSNARILRIMNTQTGRSFLPWEERYINYRVARVGLSDQACDSEAVRLMNAREDIVPPGTWRALNPDGPASGVTDVVAIWNGWGPPETEGAQKFRWVSNDAELLILNATPKSTQLNLLVAAGEGLDSEEANLFVSVNGQVVDTLGIKGYQRLVIKLPPNLPAQTVVKLHLDKPAEPTEDDPRMLSFRVFRVFLSEQPQGKK